MDFQPFNQSPPRLGNQFDDDRALKNLLRRLLPVEVYSAIEPELRELGELSGGELYEDMLRERLLEPELTQWGAWGERVDEIELTPLWKKAQELAARFGVVAAGYEDRFGEFARVHQFALVHLFAPSTDVYSCPLAMTDGAAKTLLTSGNQKLIGRALPRLTSRDPATFWTSGQWMTESTGGSDVGRSETVAVHEEGARYRLYGRKWFTSATTSEMTLTLARPEGNGPGGRGLALFYVELRDENGKLQRIEINRLKDKLGTRKVPTAELMLRGTPAELVTDEARDGIRNISPMLNITRTWNTVSAVSFMRRGIALAQDYAKRRVAFSAPLSEKPLHAETLSSLVAEYEAALVLAFEVIATIGRIEHQRTEPNDEALLRILTPLAKLVTGKQAVSVVTEAIEAFGGAGYIEDTGLPTLLRDTHVLPIWEGTTNVLSLDVIKTLSRDPSLGEQLLERFDDRTAGLAHAEMKRLASQARATLEKALLWAKDRAMNAPLELEAGARHFSLTLGRSFALGLIAAQAEYSMSKFGDKLSLVSARRFALERFDFIRETSVNESLALANDLLSE